MKTRSSSGDEIANVTFLYNDIVHVLKYNTGWAIKVKPFVQCNIISLIF